MTLRMIQAYQQAPWRIQIKWIGRLLLLLVAAAIATGLYLSISAQTAAAGVDIQIGEERIKELNLEIADLRNQLATLSSSAEMKQRAEAMNFQTSGMESTIYIVVPGYSEDDTVMIAPPPGPDRISPPLIKPSYNQSLWEWFLTSTLNENQDGNEVYP